MPLPFILGAGAVLAGAKGIESGIQGINKMKDANERLKSSEARHRRNINRFENLSVSSSEKMDDLGKFELEILESFKQFSDAIEKIQNRPKFKKYEKDGITLPEYNGEELRTVSIGASVILGSLGGAALGTAGGYAAAGAATYAVMAFGTASTGAAISGLKGAALTNATLAALGGGALGSAPWAGGMALGSTVLGAATVGVGLFVGGLIFKATGTKLSEQADEAYSQMRAAEKTILEVCDYLMELEQLSSKYYCSLSKTKKAYDNSSAVLFKAVNELGKCDWNEFSEDEKISTQNTVLLVGLLYKMCQVNLIHKQQSEEEVNLINRKDVKASIAEAEIIVEPFDIKEKEFHGDEVFDNLEKLNGEFKTENGKIYRIANKDIKWDKILTYFSDMSSDTKILELYNCDLYCHYVSNEMRLRLNKGDMLIISNCRVHRGDYCYNYNITCESGSQLIVKNCIFNKSKRFVELQPNSKLVLKNSKLEQVSDFIWASDGNAEILIEHCEINYPYKEFVCAYKKNTKTTIRECSILLSNKNSDSCIRTDKLILKDSLIYARSKSNEYGSWVYADGRESIISNCTMINLSLSITISDGLIEGCHFESCKDITSGVFGIESTIFNECSKITRDDKVSKISNCIFNKSYNLWGRWVEKVCFYDSYFINTRGVLGGNGCNYENCNFEDILVGEKKEEGCNWYRSAFYVRKDKSSFVNCVFNNIDVRREFFIVCDSDKEGKCLFLKNCEFNDCITRRSDGLFIKDIVDEKTYTLTDPSSGFKGYDTHFTGRQFNVAEYEEVYQNNCQSLLEQTDYLQFNNSNSSYLTRIITENKIGTAATLEMLDFESQINEVEDAMQTGEPKMFMGIVMSPGIKKDEEVIERELVKLEKNLKLAKEIMALTV